MKSLQQRLEQGLNPVYLVMGDALPIVSEAVAAIEAVGLAQAGIPAFNHDTVRCTEPNPERALIAARTPPMMGSLRVVVVRELGLASDAFLEGLVDYLKQPSPSTLVILTGERLPKQEKGRPAWASKIRAAMKRSGGEVLSYKQEDLRPEDDCRRYAQRLGKTLTQAAAARLVDTVGPEIGRLRGEVDKLALFVGESDEIGPDAVEECCALIAEAVIWDLTAGLATADTAQALEALYRLQQSGDEPRRLLGMIAWQCRQLLQMAALARAGASDDAIRRSVRMRWDTFKKIRPKLEPTLGGEVLLGRLAQANQDMNSHRAGAERILDGLVLELLSRPR